jgi:hypothetical protein
MINWIDAIAQAKQQARTSGKLVLVDFFSPT